MSKTYDVIIVGSGTAGQTIAYELAENHLKIALPMQNQCRYPSTVRNT